MAKKLYIIAGEASGDLHGSNLIAELKIKSPDIEIRCWGGDLMQQAGGTLVRHYKDLAFMGFIEVIMNLKTILNNMSFCKKDILEFKPDAILFIDYPGFNLRMANFAHKNGIKTFYYISPKVWAWNQKRAIKIKATIDHMFTIFPFETEFYKKFNYAVEYVGNPLLDEIEKHEDSLITKTDLGLSEKPVLALLPGSRKQEVISMLNIMLATANKFKDFQIAIAGAPSLPKEFYAPFLTDNIHFIDNKTYDLLKVSDFALVTSGTATLETALHHVPQIVCYKASKISYNIAKLVIKVKYISLVNLIMDKEVVKELIQDELTEERLTLQMKLLINDQETRNELFSDYKELSHRLGKGGASLKVATSMLKTLNW
jgi:lipid-A-disaccharide synthase